MLESCNCIERHHSVFLNDARTLKRALDLRSIGQAQLTSLPNADFRRSFKKIFF